MQMQDLTSKPLEYDSSIIAAAQGLLQALAQNVQHSASQPQNNSVQPPQQQIVQSQGIQGEMTRSFPGYFSRKKGKQRFHPLSSTLGKGKGKAKSFSLYVFLLNKDCMFTPSPTEELELSQAGLGKRVISLTADMSHREINDVLLDEYPKMNGVDGWLFFKSSGGHGRRKLTMVSPNVDGYTGIFVHSVSAGGKTPLYIVPLQQTLDLTPLPSNAPVFEKMPKAMCQMCKETMPLHILALHIEGCGGSKSASDDDEDWQDEVQIISSSSPQLEHPETGPSDDQAEKTCPICSNSFPWDVIASHASLCGTRSEPCSVLDEEIRSLADLQNEEDVLQWLSNQVDHRKKFNIVVMRDELLNRGLNQWQRQKKSSPWNKLNVSFVGEAGVDTGALSVEFLTEVMYGLERRLFEGNGTNGKSPKYSISDLESGLFRTAGEIIAVSLAQGGPAPTFFKKWCFYFLASGNFDNLQLTKDDVDDQELTSLIQRVETETNMADLTAEIINCGYTGPINADRKDNIIRAVVLHGTMRLSSILQDIRRGMKIYNLVGLLEMHPNLCLSLFVPKEEEEEVDADYIMSILNPAMSERGSQRQQKEAVVINFLQDFLQDLEGQDGEQKCDTCSQAECLGQENTTLSVPMVMQWLTGQRHKPLLQAERAKFRIHLKFDHDCMQNAPSHVICFPLVSACTRTITLPVEHMSTYSEFCHTMSVAIRMSCSFSRV